MSGPSWVAVHLTVNKKGKIMLPVQVLQPGWTLPRALLGPWLEIAGKEGYE